MTPFPALSIKTKFFLVAAVVMALSSAAWGGWSWYTGNKHLHQKLEDSGRLLLTTLRAPIMNVLIYREAGILENVDVLDTFVEDMLKTPGMPTVYAFVTDQEGRVLAHNDYHKYGTIASDPLTRQALCSENFLSSVSRHRGEEILDLALPLRVPGTCWGTLRVGYSMTPLKQELYALKWQVLGISGVFFLFGTLVFYFIGRAMSRPLEELSHAMSGVGQDSLQVVLPPLLKRHDEIGRLQKSFAEMVLRLRHSEQERQLAVNRLLRTEKLATIGQIVAGVAHEVNNPLAAMSFSLTGIEKKAPPELGRKIAIVREGLSRIETIVRQLSELSRAGTLELKEVRSDLFFKEAAGFAAVALKKATVRFNPHDACPPTTLSLDKGKLHQVVLNLLLNAADASPEDGVIDFTASEEDGCYLLAVRDRGKGIPPDEQGAIFDLFFTTKNAGKGSGIGLALCKSIVEMHRGVISLSSTPGETTFTVKIPVGVGVDEGVTHEAHEAFDS